MPSAKCGGFKNDPANVGKFLVLRRDGTVPTWTWFVLGAMDPYAPNALNAYARAIQDKYNDDEMIEYACDVRDTADLFFTERLNKEAEGAKKGDPEKGPHRKDSPLILQLLRGEVTFEQIEKALENAEIVL